MTCCADNLCVTKHVGDCNGIACQNSCRTIFPNGNGVCLPEGDPNHPKYICNCFHKCPI